LRKSVATGFKCIGQMQQDRPDHCIFVLDNRLRFGYFMAMLSYDNHAKNLAQKAFVLRSAA